ncbi:MAG: hypothetical protein ACE5NN_01870 [Candidatus Bathyarchaeia archaeon]
MIILDSLGYKLAKNQQTLTPLQRLVLLYGYAYHNAQTAEEKKAARPLDELIDMLPRD